MDAALKSELTRVHDWACGKIAANAARCGDRFPHVTDNGKWRLWGADNFAGWEGDRWTHGNWTAGFWVGELWLAYRHTGDPRFRTWAEHYGRLMESRKFDGNTHDIGFMFYPSFVLGYQLTGNPDLRAAALVTADTLCTRFNPRGRYIQSWGPLGHPLAARSTAIDTMMNLPLLWWAYRETGHGQYLQVAREHARTSLRHYVRPDGSTYHIYLFDPETGQGLEGGTYQGAGTNSIWSRGVTWGVYGWVLAYRETGEAEFLAGAEKAAASYLSRLPADYVPKWDFTDPDPQAPRDASATAIILNAFLELGDIHPDRQQAAFYRDTALKMLVSLSRHYTSVDRPEEEGLLLHSCYSRPHNDGVDSSVAWGEWFFLRAVAHLIGEPVRIP